LTALSEKQREFTAVPENMRRRTELLETHRMMASTPARRSFGVEVKAVLGAHILMLTAVVALQAGLEQAKSCALARRSV
jgi:hypothetical protein